MVGENMDLKGMVRSYVQGWLHSKGAVGQWVVRV